MGNARKACQRASAIGLRVGLGIVVAALAASADPDALGPASAGQLTPFSTSNGVMPAAWEPRTFPKIERHTQYRLVREGEGLPWVVEASSVASASGLVHRTSIDLRQTPMLSWRWKVEGVLVGGDALRKDGDDYPARVYLSFEPAEGGQVELSFWERTALAVARRIYGDVPSRAINYIWANRLERGAVVDSAYVGGFVKLVAVESGAARAGSWVGEERDVHADYVALFGAEPPPVVAVSIMTDTDDTGEQVRAWYGDIAFGAR